MTGCAGVVPAMPQRVTACHSGVKWVVVRGGVTVCHGVAAWDFAGAPCSGAVVAGGGTDWKLWPVCYCKC